MKSINCLKQIDDFIFHARIMPAATVLFPFLVCFFLNGWSSEMTAETVFILVLAVFSGQIIRVLGKQYETRFISRMGGLASTIILRFSDSTIDAESKKHYHKIIFEKLGIPLPNSPEDEASKANSADQSYMLAMNELRIYANNHRKKVPRVYQELKKYNYWRNLRGCKWIALPLYVISIIVELMRLDGECILLAIKHPNAHHLSMLFFLSWGILFLTMVTDQTVRLNAFDYAKALLESAEIYES